MKRMTAIFVAMFSLAATAAPLPMSGGTMTSGLGLNYSGVNPSTVPYLDANRRFTSSSITPTELGYLTGVTGNIQTQINNAMTGVTGNYVSKTGDSMSGNLLMTGTNPRISTTTNIGINLTGVTANATALYVVPNAVLSGGNVNAGDSAMATTSENVPFRAARNLNAFISSQIVNQDPGSSAVAEHRGITDFGNSYRAYGTSIAGGNRVVFESMTGVTGGSRLNAVTGSVGLSLNLVDQLTITGTTVSVLDPSRWPFALKNTPTVQRFTTAGSGTYTTPANVKYIKVKLVGGGGAGGGSGTASGGTGNAGGDTTFGASLTAAGGTGGEPRGSPFIGIGGAPTIATGTTIMAQTGLNGGRGSAAGLALGGPGGSNPMGGNGGFNGTLNTGQNAADNSGGGGAGGSSASGAGGNGGGAGAYIEVYINAPAASYAYTVGSGGTPTGAGTSGNNGGRGGSGYIEVTEYY